MVHHHTYHSGRFCCRFDCAFVVRVSCSTDGEQSHTFPHLLLRVINQSDIGHRQAWSTHAQRQVLKHLNEGQGPRSHWVSGMLRQQLPDPCMHALRHEHKPMHAQLQRHARTYTYTRARTHARTHASQPHPTHAHACVVTRALSLCGALVRVTGLSLRTWEPHWRHVAQGMVG